MVGARNFITSHFQQRQYSATSEEDRQPRRFRIPPGFATYDRNGIQYPLSPLSTSSSSSSSSGSEDEGFPGNLRTLPSSTFMSTPRRRISSLPPIHHHSSNSAQKESSYTPESSPMHSFENAFQPLHASTFVNRASLSEPDFTDYVSLSKDDYLYLTPPTYHTPGGQFGAYIHFQCFNRRSYGSKPQPICYEPIVIFKNKTITTYLLFKFENIFQHFGKV
ncbi:hypothetical protein Ocin01_19492 [Orchesella cincta]|uniref:Uncharacterized protein n=1 Tax=Orchesella cincta TaxID=48709 RepID=A0A1D2M2J1_ORCCI|nr:hypothetical protein Ocin01_19492 [Orchesella cincta]